jgi:phosphate/sulfate permease
MDLYVILVGFLLLLAFFDLMVGVSNDASNFLNSAIGSKVASYRTIMIFACLGVIIGATFSSGMMDIARNGIFHPDKFYFSEIIWIFVGVMVADVLLLNFFNGLGLPTSTTVSIVFDLLGASLAMAIYKLMKADAGLGSLGEYINTAKALAIISGILISVVIAFITGLLVQWITRFIFTFNYRKTYRYFGSLFGGIAITSIVYFMIMKGAKGASFMKPEYLEWITAHNWQLLAANFICWVIIMQLLMWIFKANVLKIIILVGTFALAMAFAGNDLVNFIGVPLAGLESYKLYAGSGVSDTSLLMGALNDPVRTPTLFLLIAGLVMATTLAFSRQARKVVETTVNLSRQNASEEEQFDSTLLARTIVRGSLVMSSFFDRVTPASWKKKIDKRFTVRRTDQDIAFDQVRASVNLVVASILIASATSLKLPLSTTYVTFMVGMGTSLADRAWDRETAVFRITGVITVIGGWFITAISALTMSCIITLLLIWGKWIAFGGCILVVGYFMFRALFVSEKEEKAKEEKKKKENALLNAKTVTASRVFENSNVQVVSHTIASSKLYYLTVANFLAGKRKVLKSIYDDVYELSKSTKTLKNNSYKVIAKFQGDAVEASQFFVQVVDAAREMANSVLFIYKQAYEYIDNNHTPFTEAQTKELTELNDEMSVFFNMILHTLKHWKYDDTEDIRKKKVVILNLVDNLQRKQLKRIKKQEVSTRNSVLYLNILTETKSLVLFSVSLIKSDRNFYKTTLGSR